MKKFAKNVFIVDHPLVQHNLATLRNEKTDQELFCRRMEEISLLMGYEVTKSLPLEGVKVKTPLGIADSKIVSSYNVPIIVSVWRAGEGMRIGLTKLLPTAKIGFIGLYREESSKKGNGREQVVIKEYYCKLPSSACKRTAIIVDVMLASGSSASKAISLVKAAGVTDIKFMCIVACEVGIAKVTADHPDVQFFCAAIDKVLRDDNYIDPGLGDAGDLEFGTK
jgi:uracil phosphoribosyltransferase